MNLEMSWTGKREHGKLSFELAHSTGLDFLLLVRPLLRAALHEMVKDVSVGQLPGAGSHCMIWGPSESPLLIALCLGFESPEIGEEEIRISHQAIHGLASSGLQTERFLLVHNRDGKNQEYRESMHTALQALVTSGLARTAELWDRQRLLREAFNGMLRYTLETLQRKNLSTAPIETLTRESPYVSLENVPCSLFDLVFDQLRLKTTIPVLSQGIADPAGAILDRSACNLILLTGSFGLGKTTAVARALQGETAQLLYVAGARISRKDVTSTKDYLQRCVNLQKLLDGFPEEDHPILIRVARPVIQRVLEDPATPILVVIDGIDESSFLSRHGGFQHLFNILQEVRVPVVLTMRTELWERGEESFATAFGLRAGHGHSRNRSVRRIELLSWDEERIRLLIQRYRSKLDEPAARAHLDELEAALTDGRFEKVYGDIPQRPLFLRLILDSVADRGLPDTITGRARLLYDWAVWKLYRDIQAPFAAGGEEGRLPILSGVSEATAVEIAWEAMLRAAAAMIEDIEGTLEPTGDCALKNVLSSSECLRQIEEPLGLFLNSLLLPSGPSPLGGELRVRFAHRTFQEFFLAWFSLLHPGELPAGDLPEPVREWIEQIEAEDLIPRRRMRPQLAGESQRTAEVAPPDLEIRVLTESAGNATRLRFILRSSALRDEYLDVPGPTLVRSPEDFQAYLVRKLENLSGGRDVDDSLLLLQEIEDKLTGFGRELYWELFSPGMRQAYRRLRKSIKTLTIVSDEPWIPWELVRPYDDSDPGDPINDDFLCVQFELTRWLAQTRRAEGRIRVRRLACFEAASGLPHAPEERQTLATLAKRHAGVEDASPPAVTYEALQSLLVQEIQLHHFIAHGTFEPSQPNEAGIPLPEGRVFRPIDLHGPLQTRIAEERPLVFLNACRTGQQAFSLTGLGGWAGRWVRGCGCGAFVGPIWVVSDRLASQFARAFYAALERGETFGRATREARLHVRELAPGHPAWLAYAVYAHVNGRLVLDENRGA